MANHQAKVAAYESTSRRYERRARQAIQTLREQLDKAERRINSADELDRQLVSSSGTEIAREASALAESAAAWAALREVAYFTEPETDQQWTALKDFLTKERRAHHEIVAECDGADPGHKGNHTSCDGHGHILASWLRMPVERYWSRELEAGHRHG